MNMQSILDSELFALIGYHIQLKISFALEIIILLYTVMKAWTLAIIRFFFNPRTKSMKDEIVLITGSGHGIGRQLAVEFSKLSATVVLWDKDEEANITTREMIKALDGKCHSYVCDVSVKEDVKKVAEIVCREVGDVTVLINNAGVVCGKNLLDIPDELIERTFRVNLLALFWTTRCFLPSMIEKNHGHIVNIGSSAGLTGMNKLTDYCASKFGVTGFTEVLNYELVFGGHDGVHTTLACPAHVNTGMFEGCKLRFPFLMPPLETQVTVRRIMLAILTNQKIVCTPRSVYFFAFMKTFLPVDVMQHILKFCGVSTFMDSFVGHQENHFQSSESKPCSNVEQLKSGKKSV
ncbi:hypothetical protein CHS0354_003957 [Potamilus streckersoni]|uniref:Short-chain dehydrogenase/reductase 3 n=1 Tax=Potamilus streckersoni TaxID=2493646 RepID=A0AAE0W8E8_9BIVA|nr:hypothetical protein CHS0354_003957 [Potamilus streckersoni]